LEESGLAAGLVFDGHHRTLACRELGREADCRGYTKAVRNGNQTDLQLAAIAAELPPDGTDLGGGLIL
jgi:hypothetical protein